MFQNSQASSGTCSHRALAKPVGHHCRYMHDQEHAKHAHCKGSRGQAGFPRLRKDWQYGSVLIRQTYTGLTSYSSLFPLSGVHSPPFLFVKL